MRQVALSLAALAFLLLASQLAYAQRDSYAKQRQRLVEEKVAGEGVKSPGVLKSILETERHEFVPVSQRRWAYFDMALPIGYEQTISPPFVVAYMTEQLDPQQDDKVLEIGTGSGYQAAVLSPLVKEVYSIEIVEELGRRAGQVLRRLNYENVHTKVGDGYKGWPEHAPFDKIIVTCSPEKVPQALVDQLKEGGRLVVPLGERYQQTLYLFKKQDGKLVAEKLLPTLFVPMTGAAEDNRQVLPDPLNPQVINGSFEEMIGETPKAAGWHYQRQLEIVKADDAPQGEQYARFTNLDTGRFAQGLQAFAIDGSQVKGLSVSCTIKGDGIRPGLTPSDVSGIMLIFYDENRRELASPVIGGWRGSFDWQSFTTRVRVPPKAAEGIIRVGLFGATGELLMDDVTIQPVK